MCTGIMPGPEVQTRLCKGASFRRLRLAVILFPEPCQQLERGAAVTPPLPLLRRRDGWVEGGVGGLCDTTKEEKHTYQV